jgi:signal transduction histidine kinase
MRDASAWTLLWRFAPDVLPVIALVLLAVATDFFGRRVTSADGLVMAIPPLLPRAATTLLVILPLLFRRAAPTLVLLAVGVGILLTASSITSIWTDVAAIALASYTMGERATNRTRSVATTFLAATCLMTGLLAQDAEPLSAVTLPFVILLPSWLVGDVVRGRRLEAVARAEAAGREIRDREVALRESMAEERRHVARELHDLVAHSVSVMVIQAGAARQVLDRTPAEAEAALLAVEKTGRDTMAELRTLLGALGDESEEAGGEGGGLAPQPGLDRLMELVARVRQAGLPVTIDISGKTRPLPSGVDVTAYRIVQEALTNALRYAAGATTLVQVGYEATQVRLEVLDSGPGAAPDSQGAGAGLAGLRERAGLAGGHLEAGPRLGGGWAVRAWLPLADNGA